MKFVDGTVPLSNIYTLGVCEYNGITDMADRAKCYCEEAQRMAGAGLIKVGENYIHVCSSNGLVESAKYYILVNTQSITLVTCESDAGGSLRNPTPTDKNSVYFENDSCLRYEDGKRFI